MANRANKIFHKIRPILADVVGLKNPNKLKYKNIKTVIFDVTVQPNRTTIKKSRVILQWFKKTYRKDSINY